MAEAVKVAVRVRPFNDREKSRKASLVIKMVGQNTEITDPSNPKAQPKKFAFDYSYWSHDSFKERPDGYLEPENSNYADQKKVFDDLGRGVLENAWKGYNCSLFAYGQTGSGKSFSMVGYGTNKGIVPISCEQLFTEIESKRGSCKKGEEFQVNYSMLEIYNEQVRDLLNPNSLKVKGGLKVRQSPKQGFYVEQLKSVPVHSYKEIEKKMDEGTKNRTVASTQMNATSSRAHTIVAIHFAQKQLNEAGKNMTKTSVINLVDLAGSERADSTGATGDRLKEGANINKSLSTLGNCIKALADQSSGKKNIIVPFRDSVLTKLLMNALGGNSKTIMIAALSPADINYDETLSTLRFADRAKSVKTKAVVNESPTDKLIRELREENEKLKKMLESGQIPSGGSTDGMSNDELEQLQEQLKSNQDEMEAMESSYEAKWAEREAQLKAELEDVKKEKDKEKTVPHFLNLNEDPALSGKIVHLLNTGKMALGSDKGKKAPDILLNGLGIQSDHAVVQNDKNQKVFLIPGKGAKIVHNGNVITSKKELNHTDRVLFGNSNLFVFVHPTQKAKDKAEGALKQPTYNDAQEEIAKNSGLNKLAGNGKSAEDLLLHEDLVQIWPMVTDANSMSQEMDKKVNFEIMLMSPQARGESSGRTHVCVKLRNLQTKNEFVWDRETFLNRFYLMQEMYQNFVDGDNSVIAKEEDPFWEDPTAPVLIGCVHVYLQSLAYLIEIEESLQITNHKGDNVGNLTVSAYPCEKNGKAKEDDYVEEPSELVGKALHFKFTIKCARGLPKQYKQSFCQFRLYIDDQPTKSSEAKGMNAEFAFEKQFDFNPVTTQFVDYLQNKALVVEVWGRQEPRQGHDDLSTQELMIKDKSKVARQATNDPHYKMAAEMAMYKRRMERAEAKMNKAIGLVRTAKLKKQKTLNVDDLDRMLRSGSRLKAVANVILQTEKAKKASTLGNNASQACVIQ